MSELFEETVQDLRSGRTSWRVYLLFIIPALVAGVIAGLIQ